MSLTNLISIAYAVFATRPELTHGDGVVNNVLFYGNLNGMTEADFTKQLIGLIYKGDELYKTIAKDTFYLGKTMDKKFKLLRKSFHIFLIGIILSVLGFIACHVMFGGFI